MKDMLKRIWAHPVGGGILIGVGGSVFGILYGWALIWLLHILPFPSTT